MRKTSKILSIFLVLFLLFSLSIQVFGASRTYVSIKVIEKSGTVKMVPSNNDMGRAYIDSNGRTQVPIRALAETCGFEVDWEEGRGGDHTVWMYDNHSGWWLSHYFSHSKEYPGGDEINVWDPVDHLLYKTVRMDTSSFIENDRVYIPVRYVSEAFGYDVKWDNEKKQVIVRK